MKIGHNSKATKPATVSADRLKSFVERIERLEEERVAIASDIKDIYTEAKAIGYDVGTMRKVIRLRGMDAADRAEQEALLETYMHALGMIDRIDARLAAGESQRQIAEAENVSKSTVQRRGPKTEDETASSKMDRLKPEDGDDGITETPAPQGLSLPKAPETAEASPSVATPASQNGGVEAGTHSKSCGGVESRHAKRDQPDLGNPTGDGGSRPTHIGANCPAGVAPGPHDTDDDLAIPPFLRGSRTGRGA